MIDVLVRKLPEQVSKEWLKHKQEKNVDTMVSEDIFRELIGFLKVQKEITKEYLHKQETSNDKSKTHTSHVTGQTFTIQQQRYPTRISKNGEKKFEPLCLTCKGTKNPQDARHWTNECFKWTALKLPERRDR